MTNKNIQMKKREGNDWDNLFPITLNENVFNENGVDLNTQMQEVKDNVLENKNEITDLNDDLKKTVTIIKPEMSVTEIQSLLNESGHFYFSKGVYSFDVPDDYDPAILDVQSNTTIVFDQESVLKLNEHNALRYKVLFIKDKENVKLINPTVDGSRTLNSSTDGEWGMGLSIVGSKNVYIDNGQFNNCWGDGIYIGRYGSNETKSTNIYLDNVVCDNNRRQGISVISVNGLYGRNVTLKNTNGTAPEAGLDFEPNNADEELDNIYFDGLKLHNNNGNGLMFYLNNFTSDDYKMNMIFNQVESIGNKESGVSFLRFNGKSKGTVRFTDPYIKESGSKGIYIRGMSKEFSKMIFDNPIIVNNNTSKTGGVTQGASITVLRSTADFEEDPTFKMGNFEVINPVFLEEDNFTRYGSYFSFSEQLNSDLNIFENIVIDGIRNNTFTNNLGLLNNTNKFVNTKINKSSYWPGTTPVTQTFPKSEQLVDEVGFTTKECIVQLSHADKQDIAKEMTFRVDTTGDYRQVIRPPKGEYLYPRTLTSNSTGKGIKTSYVGNDNVESYVTVKRLNGRWVIIDIVGNWSAET